MPQKSNRGVGQTCAPVHALGPPRRLSSGLHGGQQQRNENPDDGNHHQKLDERERSGRARWFREFHEKSPWSKEN